MRPRHADIRLGALLRSRGSNSWLSHDGMLLTAAVRHADGVAWVQVVVLEFPARLRQCLPVRYTSAVVRPGRWVRTRIQELVPPGVAIHCPGLSVLRVSAWLCRGLASETLSCHFQTPRAGVAVPYWLILPRVHRADLEGSAVPGMVPCRGVRYPRVRCLPVRDTGMQW